ncbi:MAG: Jag N-terminal domain-containing protein [Anaerolineae bacterium]|nr:Jag N-terminal domain-containing protein [Anaerolineae bacterium]
MSDNESLKPIDITAPSLEEAIDNGLRRLGLTRDDVIIEIIEEGSRGVLGMGSRNAVVRLTPLKPPRYPEPEEMPEPEPPAMPDDEIPDEPFYPVDEDDEDEEQSYQVGRQIAVDLTTEEEARISAETLRELLSQMEIQAEVETYRAEAESSDEEPPWVLDIHGPDLGILIGRRGETLNAVQYITRLIVSRELQRRANIVVDVEGYKMRREQSLRKLAKRMADQACRMGRTVTLEPMPPNERRIIHIALRGDQSVSTESVGAGDQRKVTIIPVLGK